MATEKATAAIFEPSHGSWLRATLTCRMRSGLPLVFLAACGRIGFTDTERQGPCPALITAPNPFTVSGETFTFPNFMSTLSVPSVAITAFDTTTGEQVASTSSGSDGTYSLEIHGGISRALRLDLANNNYLVTHQYTGMFLDGTLANYQSPLWSGGALDTVYMYSSFMRDNTKGNINIAIEQCDGAPIDGATVKITPSPGALEYLNMDSMPNSSLESTVLPHTSAIGFNVEPGPIHITASKPGMKFDAVDLTISGGEQTNVIVMHAYE